MRNSSSDDNTPNHRPPPSRPVGVMLPMRPTLPMSNSANSSSEDFRSVIDDLTIENKRLKKRLKKYEKSNNVALHDDKLFEIRMHGLPPDKRIELEEYLKRFT